MNGIICCALFFLAVATSALRVPRQVDEDPLETLNNTLIAALQQLMNDRLYMEEKTRSEGDSGIKQVRLNRQGTKSYHSPTFVGRRVVAIHEHSNNIRTIGMGEFIAVLNGVEFRTRHNDYSLKMPSTTSEQLHETEDIPFPDVPTDVTDKQTVDEQVIEMRKYFEAWIKQDMSIKEDYNEYFKPVLCYLEGAWTDSVGSVEESFDSDRHLLAAKTWHELQNKIRFTSATGNKDLNENYAYLPSIITEIYQGLPKFAQWNYRILCHPIQRNIPLNRFRVVNDLSSRMAEQRDLEQHSTTRAARFQLNPFDQNTWRKYESYKSYGLLDELMEEIPGKNNYPADLEDTAFNMEAKEYNDKGATLNAGYYHRRWQVTNKDAMGGSTRVRAYADANIFMAMNTQPKIVPSKVKDNCDKQDNCDEYEQKWSYAIPLEIIYLTPLSKWNPYNLTYRGDARKTEGKKVQQPSPNDRRDGKKEKPYYGTNSKVFFQTPIQFFTGKSTEADRDPADTAEDSVWVEDPNNVAHEVAASGHRITFPGFEGLPVVRQRYPIMPAHAEGNAVWKELEALKTMVMDMQKYQNMFEVTPSFGSGNGSTVVKKENVVFWTSDSVPQTNTQGPHFHTMEITPFEMLQLKSGVTVEKRTEEVEGHSHLLLIKRSYNKSKGIERFRYTFCDGLPRCWDKHQKSLKHVT